MAEYPNMRKTYCIFTRGFILCLRGRLCACVGKPRGHFPGLNFKPWPSSNWRLPSLVGWLIRPRGRSSHFSRCCFRVLLPLPAVISAESLPLSISLSPPSRLRCGGCALFYMRLAAPVLWHVIDSNSSFYVGMYRIERLKSGKKKLHFSASLTKIHSVKADHWLLAFEI